MIRHFVYDDGRPCCDAASWARLMKLVIQYGDACRNEGIALGDAAQYEGDDYAETFKAKVRKHRAEADELLTRIRESEGAEKARPHQTDTIKAGTDYYRAVCRTCSWASRRFESAREAEQDGVEHARGMR